MATHELRLFLQHQCRMMGELWIPKPRTHRRCESCFSNVPVTPASTDVQHRSMRKKMRQSRRRRRRKIFVEDIDAAKPYYGTATTNTSTSDSEDNEDSQARAALERHQAIVTSVLARCFFNAEQKQRCGEQRQGEPVELDAELEETALVW